MHCNWRSAEDDLSEVAYNTKSSFCFTCFVNEFKYKVWEILGLDNKCQNHIFILKKSI